MVDQYISGADVTEDMEKDNKWAFSGGFLWTRNGVENVPDISFEIEVPDGVYRMHVKMFNSRNHKGAPASAVKLQFAGEDEARNIVCTSLPETEAEITAVPAGAVIVENGRLVLTVRGGDPGFWTMLHSIELFPERGGPLEGEANPGSEESAPGTDSEYHELMRGLGYM